jgi:hypothetical protein
LGLTNLDDRFWVTKHAHIKKQAIRLIEKASDKKDLLGSKAGLFLNPVGRWPGCAAAWQSRRRRGNLWGRARPGI